MNEEVMDPLCAGQTAADTASPLPSWVRGASGLRAGDSVSAWAVPLGMGLGASALLGVGVGLPQGIVAALHHALAIPVSLALLSLLVGPAAFILLSIVGAATDAPRALATLSRGVFVTGLLYAGLAPLSGLYIWGAESGVPRLVTLLTLTVGLAAGGLHVLSSAVDLNAGASSPADRLRARLVLALTGVFGYAVALRIWFGMLPVIGGGA